MRICGNKFYVYTFINLGPAAMVIILRFSIKRGERKVDSHIHRAQWVGNLVVAYAGQTGDGKGATNLVIRSQRLDWNEIVLEYKFNCREIKFRSSITIRRSNLSPSEKKERPENPVHSLVMNVGSRILGLLEYWMWFAFDVELIYVANNCLFSILI